MSDIAFGEKTKKILRLLLKMGLRHLKLDYKMIDDNLKYTANPITRNINAILIAGSNQIKPEWQRKSLRRFGQIGLWIATKDTAYRDVFFWMLHQILKKADELLKIIEPYVKPPEEWHPNLWIDSREKTRQLQKENKILPYEKSFEESVFVTSTQNKRHKQLQKK